MAEGFSGDTPEDVRLREIQASIDEGKMMLQVLRSLPPSEDNDAIIHRFEELVSRLELHGRNVEKAKEPEEFLRSQLIALKDKQLKIKNMLKQTAQQIHVNSPEFGMDAPGTSDNLKSTVSSILSVPSSGVTLPVDTKTVSISSHEDSSAVNLNGLKNNTLNLEVQKESELSPNMTSASDTLNSLVNSQLQSQLARLKDLSEDTERFQSLVERLMAIIKNMSLPQEANLLFDISTRFTELQNNFQTLQQNCEDLQNDASFTAEARATRLMEVHDFSASLSKNLESTKECFCSTYYLVKSSLETEVEGDPTAIGETMVNGNEAALSTAPTQATELPTSFPSMCHVDLPKAEDRDHKLTNATASELPSSPSAQKAYLSMLQNETAMEQKEIALLLLQREQLTERLNMLKAAHARLETTEMNNAPPDGYGEPSTDTVVGPVPTDEPSDVTAEDGIRSSLLNHLDAKTREVEELKAQLALLRKTEATVKAGNSSKPHEVITLGCSKDASLLKSKNNGVQQTNVTSKARFAISSDIYGIVYPQPINGEVSSSKCDSTNFQEPTGNNITANTEILYENMREARIRLEEQRNRFVRYPMGQSNKQNLQQVVCGGASVATSQDRTTLATWGGSSPVPSSSASRSSDGPEDEGAISGSSSAPVVHAAQSSNEIDQLELPTVERQPRKSSLSSRRSGRIKNAQPHCVDEKDSYSAQSDLSRSLLPRVGHSPSPSDPHFQPQASAIKLSPEQSLGYSPSKPVPLNVETPSVSYSKLEQLQNAHSTEHSLLERVNRLENSVTQLHQVCRYLVLENAQLSASVNQLMTAPCTSQSNYLPRSNLLSGDTVSGSHHSLATVATGGLMGNNAVAPLGIGPTQKGFLPFTLNQFSAEGDQIQSLINRLMQQQANYLGLQNDVQRLLLQHQAAVPVKHAVHLNASQSNLASQLMSPNTASYPPLSRIPPVCHPCDIPNSQYLLNTLPEGLASSSNSYWTDSLRSQFFPISAIGPFCPPGLGSNLNSTVTGLNSFASLQAFLNQTNDPSQVTSTLGLAPIVTPPVDLYAHNQPSPAIHPQMLLTGAPLVRADLSSVSSSADQIWLPPQPAHLGRDSM